MRFEYHLLVVLLPLAITNILHMLVVKYDLAAGLAVPFSVPAFGKGKTWRGLLFMTVVNGLVLWLIALLWQLSVPHPLVLGCILGLAYILFELPNSYMKRRLGIPSGGRHPTYGWVFSLVDKSDSAIGVILVYYGLSSIGLAQALLLLMVSSGVHILFSFILVSLKLKSSF